jgi:TonB family protein
MDTSPRDRLVHWRTASLVLLLCTAPWSSALPEATFDSVLSVIERGNSTQAVNDLLALANRGDARAQYLLGLAYLEAKWVELNIPQALSWLTLAADGYDGSFATSAADEARQALLKFESRVSGPDLIKADQITAAFLANYNGVLKASEARGRLALRAASATTDATTEPASGVMFGCALAADQGSCPKEAAQLSGERCAGVFPPPQTPASNTRSKQDAPAPTYPKAARRWAWEGKAIFLAHIDRSGYVCRVTLIQNTDFEELDLATLNAVRRWRFTPAQADGQPVESIESGGVIFQLTDLQFK